MNNNQTNKRVKYKGEMNGKPATFIIDIAEMVATPHPFRASMHLSDQLVDHVDEVEEEEGDGVNVRAGAFSYNASLRCYALIVEGAGTSPADITRIDGYIEYDGKEGFAFQPGNLISGDWDINHQTKQLIDVLNAPEIDAVELSSIVAERFAIALKHTSPNE